MQVTVRYYAMLKEQRGLERETVEVPSGTTAGALYEALFPPPRVPVQAAVAHQLVPLDTVLDYGAEVVFLPPVGGG